MVHWRTGRGVPAFVIGTVHNDLKLDEMEPKAAEVRAGLLMEDFVVAIGGELSSQSAEVYSGLDQLGVELEQSLGVLRRKRWRGAVLMVSVL